MIHIDLADFNGTDVMSMLTAHAYVFDQILNLTMQQEITVKKYFKSINCKR